MEKDRLHYVAGQLDQSGSLRVYRRGNGQEVVRLTVVNLSQAAVDELREGFGVGSQLGHLNDENRGLTWSVEGRWACRHVASAVIPYLENGSFLHRSLFTLLHEGPVPPSTECDLEGCAAPVRARALCGPHLRAAQRLHLLGPATHGDPSRCPICADRHLTGAYKPSHLCRRCSAALRLPPGTPSAGRP